MDKDLLDAIRGLVVDLSQRAYAKIIADGRGGRLTEDEIRRAVSEYGRTLVPIPDEGWSLIDLYPQDDDATSMTLDVPSWTLEEGRSDLTLSLSARKRGNHVDVAIDDLHVL